MDKVEKENGCELESDMVQKVSWKDFRETGLLWFANSILHVFGYAIALTVENDEVLDAYPVRTKFRGFSEKINTEGYIKVSKHLADNATELLKEAQD